MTRIELARVGWALRAPAAGNVHGPRAGGGTSQRVCQTTAECRRGGLLFLGFTPGGRQRAESMFSPARALFCFRLNRI
jgi:hypothetical protein